MLLLPQVMNGEPAKKRTHANPTRPQACTRNSRTSPPRRDCRTQRLEKLLVVLTCVTKQGRPDICRTHQQVSPSYIL